MSGDHTKKAKDSQNLEPIQGYIMRASPQLRTFHGRIQGLTKPYSPKPKPEEFFNQSTLRVKMVSTIHIFLTLAVAMSASAFRFRVYSNGGCDHSSPADATWPPNNVGPYVCLA